MVREEGSPDLETKGIQKHNPWGRNSKGLVGLEHKEVARVSERGWGKRSAEATILWKNSLKFKYDGPGRRSDVLAREVNLLRAEDSKTALSSPLMTKLYFLLA